MSDGEFEDTDAKLEELAAQVTDLGERCHYRTMLRVANEARRLARVERQLMPYMTASFHVMNDSRNVLHPTAGREMAIELITLLESEDRARQFQPNLPEEEYERTKWWLTACAYDNLAVNTAESNGYNSDGMHQCITDGIQVCRRTGKMQCISCFREYATDVYVAADDLDMALHHARVGINNKDPGPHDRRHIGAKDSERILVLHGQVEAAIEMLDLAWKLADVYHSPYAGKLDTHTRAVELFHLAGCPERLEKLPRLLSFDEGEQYTGPADDVLIEPPRDEYPSYFLDRDLADSFVACCRDDYEAAAALLQPWDVLLREQKCLTKWFEVRLRLVAIARLTGKLPRAQALGKPLREAAEPARDWMALRRLERVLDESIAATPLALSAPVTVGPFAEKPRAVPVDQPVPAGGGTDAAAPGEDSATSVQDPAGSGEEPAAPATPLGETIMSYYMRLMQSGGVPEQLAAIIDDILAIDPESVSHPGDAGRLMHVTRFVGVDGAKCGEVWTWAESITQRHPQDATALSMLAALGASLRDNAEGALAEVVTDELLEKLFRQSLDLDPHAGDNFARAGSYYLDQENHGEAERCLARGFRLMRSSGHLALKLAEVYSRTDRPRDAVAVLDMALREGCDDPDVAWEAAVSANHLEQFEAALTYLDRFDELRPDQPWSNYYRACALLDLDRPAEALAALDRESQFNPDLTYHVAVQRASCLAGLKRGEDFRRQLAEVLATPVADVTYLTPNGLQRIFTRLWKSTSEFLAVDDPLLEQFETRLLEMGLAPNELFAAHRERTPAVEGDDENEGNKVNFYRCIVRQPLDERWQSFAGRLAGEDDWTAYVIPWGVLAHDETEAAKSVLGWQRRCFPLPAEILEVEEEGTDYADVPGVVWQGFREEFTADHDNDAELDEDEQDFDQADESDQAHENE
jgi:tetratricopeptide (TPR) repeat protein